MYYVFQLAPDQTASMDRYFLKKLLNIKADDSFQMNQVLVALWFIMGLWPLVYSMLLLPSGRRYQILTGAGLGLMIYAGLATGDDWKEFYHYFRESKIIHLTSLDFSLLTYFTTFWVYNGTTARKWFDRGSWLLPVALIPFIGPSLYLLLRSSLSAIVAPIRYTTVDED